MNSNNQDENSLKQKLASIIQNKRRIKQIYTEKGIQMITKPELVISDMREPQLEPQIDYIYSQIKQELSVEGFVEFRFLGEGFNGIVILAKKQKTNIRYAIKSYHFNGLKGNMQKDIFDRAKNEINILKKCQGSPYVINILGEITGKQFIYLILNECQGTLAEVIDSQPNKTLNELSTIKYAKDIAQGLQFIHSKNYVHNDIRPQNILIDYHGNAVISDFDFANKLDSSGYGLNEYGGNVFFQAPETYNSKIFSTFSEEYQKRGIVVSSKSSIKSEACFFGYLIYTMIERSYNFKKFIFNKHNPITYGKQFMQLKYSKFLKQIIDGLTQFIPNARLSINEALNILNEISYTELLIDNQLFQMIDEQTYKQINNLNKNIEFVESFGGRFYPIIQDEDNIMKELEVIEKQKTQVAEQKDYKSLQKDINLKCKEFKLNYEIVLEYINYLASLKCQCLDIIGKGSFGFVIKAIYQNNLVAIKIIEVKNEQNANKLKLEQQLLEKFQDSKYILNLRKTLDAKLSSPLLFIFTDLCQGELTDLINKNIPKKQIISIIIQLLIGLEELKSLKILHVDIKPQNILYNYENGNYLIKIADFGQAKQLQDKGFTISLSRCGTPKYTSQEVLDQDAQISYKSDIYSLGIVFIELIFGRLFDFQEEIRPLRQGKLNILSERPKVQNRSFDQTDDFLIEKIIKNMIQKNQNERKDSDELLFLIFKQHLTDLKYYQICLNQVIDKF